MPAATLGGQDGGVSTVDDVQRMVKMSATWAEVRRTSQRKQSDLINQWSARFRGLSTEQDRLARLGAWTSGASNLMEVLDLPRAEVANCRVLCWILDPIARHGIGASMVAALATALNVDVADATAVRASTEITISEARADVVLRGTRPGRSIVIEAKVDAGEQPSQAARLERDWPDADVLVFLTTTGVRKPVTAEAPERWRALSWRWFADQAARSLLDLEPASDERSADARLSVMAWLAAVRRNLG